MGVEYIISEQLFGKLPDAEKALWHSHVHEVKSGQLVAPGIPDIAEHALMEKLIHTYGKTCIRGTPISTKIYRWVFRN
ncbi:hypothetical protein PS838_05157 [Pseudomonas fluorescens]|nr:hypothetical protein PS838_05157 [Pseudomonas fluorescens]